MATDFTAPDKKNSLPHDLRQGAIIGFSLSDYAVAGLERSGA
jgi:hypothetical protein